VTKPLWQMWTGGGDRAVVHGLQGLTSNRKLPADMKQRAMALFARHTQAQRWHDYGPTLDAEECSRKLDTIWSSYNSHSNGLGSCIRDPLAI
jgi:hypothetical protein